VAIGRVLLAQLGEGIICNFTGSAGRVSPRRKLDVKESKEMV
jgi:hypothetical protein